MMEQRGLKCSIMWKPNGYPCWILCKNFFQSTSHFWLKCF
jgi:hypothetical protein